MTESEWLECANSRTMLMFLHGKISNRKLRLFACGFCQSIDEILADVDCRNAVQVAERFADGIVSPQELQAACASARLVWAASEWKGMLAASATESDCWAAASGVQSALEMDGIPRSFWKRQSGVLRDIYGNPFRPVVVDPAWLTPAVVELARRIYDDREFDRLPVLSDALEEAGCDNPDILAHLRGPGRHVRGCWILDLLLGKE